MFSLWLSLSAAVVAADSEPPRVRLLLSGDGGAYAEVASAFAEVLNQRSGGRVGVVSGSVDAFDGWGDERLVVTVGHRAAGRVLEASPPVPVLSVLIPRKRYLELAGASEEGGARSAIYLDQPLDRQLRLVRAALPDRRRFGVLLGPGSAEYADKVEERAARFGLEANLLRMGPDDNHVAKVREVLREGDVLLALPDPLVYNARSIRSVLLTTYRLRAPLIGFSEGYVKAGALAALFTTPRQVGTQAAEMAARWIENGRRRLPPPDYPSYFSVAVNERVARSLGVDPPDAERLERAVARQEEEKP